MSIRRSIVFARRGARAFRWLVLLSVLAALVLGAGCSSRRREGPPSATATAPISSVSWGPSGPVATNRLEPGDFDYVGAFRLPEPFDWGARAMAYLPQQGAGPGQLLVVGHDQRQAELAPVHIPVPVVARQAAALPLATLAGPMRSFDGAIVESVSAETAFASGLAVVARQGSQRTDKLYGAIDNWYGVTDDSHPTIWFAELDGSRPRGPFHVGPPGPIFHGNKAGDYLFSVPPNYAAQYLGGRTLVTGKTRGAFHGSQGPTLLAFRPWDREEPSGALDALVMLSYRIRFPECAGPNVGHAAACDFPKFTMCDKWEGASFVGTSSRAAIVLFGVKGLGPNHYGEAPDAQSCERGKGYHCDPYERQILFYDVHELGAVALGQSGAHSVLPYAVWRPRELLLEGHTCGQVGDMTYDPAHRRLYAIEKGIGESNSAVVHVWSVRS